MDVNDITTSDKNLNAAKKLSATIGKSGITAATKKTDSNGKVSFTDLPQGMYLVEETDGASYGTFSPFLVAIPYMEDGENWIYPFTARRLRPLRWEMNCVCYLLDRAS